MSQYQSFPFDALRQLGVRLLVKRGLTGEAASSFLNAVLWYDATGASKSGIETLPSWLMALDNGDVNPQADGDLSREFTGTAVLDGKKGAAPLMLIKAARIAQEKAREYGIGIVRVTNIAGQSTPEPAAFDIAIGPMIGVVHGFGPSLTVAVPTMGAVPAIFSSAIGEQDALVPPWSIHRLPVWAFPFATEGEWLVSAYAVTAFETLASFHERVAGQLHAKARVAGEVRSEDWQATRSDQYENGLTISSITAEMLRLEAVKHDLEFPNPKSV